MQAKVSRFNEIYSIWEKYTKRGQSLYHLDLLRNKNQQPPIEKGSDKGYIEHLQNEKSSLHHK